MEEEKKYSTVIKPANKLMDFKLKEVKEYKDLTLLFVRRTFVAQYKQTILGPAWAVVQPLLTTFVFAFVFGNMAGLGPAGVPAFLFYLCANIAWQYFSTSLTTISNTFIANSAVFGKVYFPRIVMPISSVLSQLISFLIQFALLIVTYLIYWATGYTPQMNINVLMIPLLVLQMACLGLGCGIIISALTTKYRDLAMLVGFGTQLWMYATPVAYAMSSVGITPDKWYYTLYMLNPMTPIIEMFRNGFLGSGAGEANWMFYGIGWITTFVIMFVGILLFNKVERTFMDTI